MKSENKINYFINLCFFLYFIILIVERILSVTNSMINGVNVFSSAFNTYTYLLVFMSIGSFIIFLSIMCRRNISSLFKVENNIEFNNLCIASGILLLSGMVHTEYTIPVVQFISYGILIIGILLKVILNNHGSLNRLLLWVSFAYLVSYSMAIPVMYESHIEKANLFHIFEGVASFSLVAIFTYLMMKIFKKNDDLFYPVPLIVALVLDVTLIVLRWEEEINYFVLVFIALSSLLFITGTILKKITKKDKNKSL